MRQAEGGMHQAVEGTHQAVEDTLLLEEGSHRPEADSPLPEVGKHLAVEDKLQAGVDSHPFGEGSQAEEDILGNSYFFNLQGKICDLSFQTE